MKKATEKYSKIVLRRGILGYWKWKKGRWLIALALFWCLNTLLANLLFRLFQQESVYIDTFSLSSLIFLIWCVTKDREWKVPVRIVFVVIVWLVHQSCIHALFYAILRDNRIATHIAALLITIAGMRRSTVFVEPKYL